MEVCAFSGCQANFDHNYCFTTASDSTAAIMRQLAAKQILLVAAFVCVYVLIASRQKCAQQSMSTGNKTKVAHVTPPLIPPDNRDQKGYLLESLNFKRGAELGVQQGPLLSLHSFISNCAGLYSEILLQQWPSAERMYLVGATRQLL